MVGIVLGPKNTKGPKGLGSESSAYRLEFYAFVDYFSSILHDPKKVNWNWKLNFIECPIIKHLILSPDSLWRFCPRPVCEDFVPGLFVKNVDNS